jgi:hypothetical protein
LAGAKPFSCSVSFTVLAREQLFGATSSVRGDEGGGQEAK